MKKLLFATLVVLITLGLSCTRELDGTTSADERIQEALRAKNLTLESFQLPRLGELDKIPQSIDNPITAKKVELGRSIFWDPVFNQNTFSSQHAMTASCGSCHIKDGHAGVRQGLGEGGLGTGIIGEKRDEDTSFINMPHLGVEFIDAQPIRPPTNMHVAYKPNALWNGALGNPDTSKLINNFSPNHNRDVSFPDEFPFDLATAFNGFGGPEMQGMAGLRVHRYRFNEGVIDSAGSRYKQLFKEVFVDDPETRIIDKFNNRFVQNNMFLDRGRILLTNSDINSNTDDDTWVPVQYSRLAAAMAVSAYTRSVIANEAPFQDYVYGDSHALTEQQKRGFVVFLEKNCVNCHNGPALTDADFHAMGTKDLLELDASLGNRVGNPIAGFIPNEVLDAGRFNVTGREEDRGKFMTQTLYNLPTTNFFHGGEFIDLEAAVDYMLLAQRNVDKQFADDPKWTRQTVTTEEKNDLIEFLKFGLRDNNFDSKYRPGSGGLSKVFSCDNKYGVEICSPNNDGQSKNDGGVSISCCN